MKEMNNEKKINVVEIPEGTFCGHNCADGCIYWHPNKKNGAGRQYCSYYKVHYYPRERQGCLSFKGYK